MKRKTTKERIDLCNNLHNEKYNYSKSDFTKVKGKAIISCPIHGDFQMSFDEHYTKKRGCPKCGRIKNTEMFIEKATSIHNGIYDYSLVNYKSSHDKVKIICAKHGIFEQTPNAHLNGQGCPHCHSHSKLEERMTFCLEQEKISFQRQKKFDWLGKFLSLDFYLPIANIAIECQGKQHFGQGGWSKDFDFDKQLERDERKRRLCEENGMTLFYLVPQNMHKQGDCDNYFTNERELLKEVKYLLMRQENN